MSKGNLPVVYAGEPQVICDTNTGKYYRVIELENIQRNELHVLQSNPDIISSYEHDNLSEHIDDHHHSITNDNNNKNKDRPAISKLHHQQSAKHFQPSHQGYEAEYSNNQNNPNTITIPIAHQIQNNAIEYHQ